jgi:Fic family protein
MAAKTTSKKKSGSMPPTAKPLSIEERTSILEKRLAAAPAELVELYRKRLDMSWIYHDSALEGSVYSEAELEVALEGSNPSATPTSETGAQPASEDIRRHRDAINHIRALALKRTEPITVDTLREFYLILHPDEGDIKSVRYRKDIPQHRLYFHEYAPPDKIATKLRQVVDWVNDPEVVAGRSGLRLAARAHYDVLRVFPFPTDSGKVARLLLNLLLLRAGYPPAIIHMSERQRYYESIKASSAAMTQIVSEAIDNNLKSIEQMLDALARQTQSAAS